MKVTIADLLDLFEDYKGTLKNLFLHDFGLHAGSDRNWMQLAKSARERLRFPHADMRIYEIIDDDDALDNRLYQWGRPLVAELTRQTEGRNLDKAGSAKVAIMHTLSSCRPKWWILRNELTLGSFFRARFRGSQNVSFWY